MIAIIKWKKGSPNVLPEKIDIPIGVELLLSEKNYRWGVVQHWVETTYKWGVDRLDFTDEMHIY